jgi:hypothetical protein
MLLKFTDDFVNTIENGKLLIGDINHNIAVKEPFLGSSKVLDRLYAQSVVISGIIDYLENSDNSTPREDESLLLCLRSALDKNLCRRFHNKIKDTSNFHTNLLTIPTPTGKTIVFPTIPTPKPTPVEIIEVIDPIIDPTLVAVIPTTEVVPVVNPTFPVIDQEEPISANNTNVGTEPNPGSGGFNFA